MILNPTNSIAGNGVDHPTTLNRFIDNVERVALLALYAWLVARIVHEYQAHGRLPNLLILPSEGLVVLFMLLRKRAIAISSHPGEWLLAAAGTCTPLLVASGSSASSIQQGVGTTLLVMGLLVQFHAKLSLGRSFGCVPANRGIKLSGPYRFVRHPMYAGYLMSHVGFLSINPSLWNLAIYGICYAAQVPRLLAEERLLARDPVYREYQAQVRHRLIPGLF